MPEASGAKAFEGRLVPGDMLYIPRGWIAEARTTAAGPRSHLVTFLSLHFCRMSFARSLPLHCLFTAIHCLCTAFPLPVFLWHSAAVPPFTISSRTPESCGCAAVHACTCARVCVRTHLLKVCACGGVCA